MNRKTAIQRKIEILKISLFGGVNGNTSQLLAFDVVKELYKVSSNLTLVQQTIEGLILDYLNAEFSYDIESINHIEGAIDFIDSIMDDVHDKLMGCWGVKKTLSKTAKAPLKYGGLELDCYIFIIKDELIGS